ncbi:MAG: DNA gyrase subunit A [bacterium]
MDNLVPRLYKEYGLESNERMLPYIIDGLRPSERRVLFSSYEIARDKFKKTLTVDSNTTGCYHPHGSTAGTIAQLVRRGFLEGQGNFGSDIGTDPDSTKPAAPRYTECKLNDFSKKLCFKLLKYVPTQTAEVDSEKVEPTFLPTMFPICLLGNKFTEGIGFGYKPVIPCYTIEDLTKRLLYLLKKDKSNPIIKPNVNCQILSSEKELENLLTIGKEKILIKGLYEHDPLNKKVIIKSLPPKLRFDTLLKKLDSELSNEDISWVDKSSRMYGGTYIEFSVNKQKNIDKIYNNMLNKIDKFLVSTVHFEIIVIDENHKIKKVSVDEFLLKTYEKYKEICQVMFNESIKKLDSFLNEYENLKKVRPYLVDYLQKNKTINNQKEAIKTISNNSKVEVSIIKNLFSKYNINKLLSLEVDTNEIEKEKLQYLNYLEKPDKYVLNDYKNFNKGEKK